MIWVQNAFKRTDSIDASSQLLPHSIAFQQSDAVMMGQDSTMLDNAIHRHPPYPAIDLFQLGRVSMAGTEGKINGATFAVGM